MIITGEIGYSKPIVTDIFAELNPGDFVCLIGRNGSGKTTLLKKIARGDFDVDVDHALCSTHCALVLTAMPYLLNTTVFELVSYGRLPYLNVFAKMKEQDISAVNRAIETVGITALRDRKFCELSDGEKQKVMIARALAQETEIILLDEPSAFLDYPSKHELMKLLVSLAHDQKKSIVLSSHDLDLVKTYADKIWHIKNGKLSVFSANFIENELNNV